MLIWEYSSRCRKSPHLVATTGTLSGSGLMRKQISERGFPAKHLREEGF
jgi:hypothetical protein